MQELVPQSEQQQLVVHDFSNGVSTQEKIAFTIEFGVYTLVTLLQTAVQISTNATRLARLLLDVHAAPAEARTQQLVPAQPATVVQEVAPAAAPEIDYQRLAEHIVPLLAPATPADIDYGQLAEQIAARLSVPAATPAEIDLKQLAAHLAPLIQQTAGKPAPIAKKATLTNAEKDANLDKAYKAMVEEGITDISAKDLAKRAGVTQTYTAAWLNENPLTR